MGQDSGLVVSILAFYSDYLSWNPAGYLYSMSEKTKGSEKVSGVGPSSKRTWLNKNIVTVFYGKLRK